VLGRVRALALAGAVVVLAGLLVVARESPPGPVAGNLGRFARATLGGDPGRALAQPAAPEPKSEEGAPTRLGLTDLPSAVLPPARYRTPNGWLLRPAGAQVETSRAPTGVTVSPDGGTVAVVSSGTAEEFGTIVDARTLLATRIPSSDLYLGAAIDRAGNLWVSGGSRDRVLQYRLVGPLGVGVRQAIAVPGIPNNGIPVIGYPGSLALGSNGLLAVAGNLSLPGKVVRQAAGRPCPASSICSVVTVLDVSRPFALAVPRRVIPVGRDAFGLALNEAAGVLYVTNWADETNPARAGGTGTVSVVDLRAGREVQVVPVGHHPTGIALRPDRRALFVANAADDSLSRLALDPATGMVTGETTIDVRTTPDAPRGAAPLALAFTPDGSSLLVGLAGQNAVEVRTADGEAIPRRVRVGPGAGATVLAVPHTYIPTGWYPSAIAAAPHPVTGRPRLYVANLKGIGSGPGPNAYAEKFLLPRSEGSLSVIDLDPASYDVWTATVVENNRWVTLFDRTLVDAARDPCRPAPLPAGSTTFSQVLCDAWRGTLDPRPFHVVYVVKENKTFDQYFGDVGLFGLRDADADPTWLLYGYPVTTNQHHLARRFTLFDNFWADSEQSTTGHSWTSAGYATEYVEITWNPEYSQGLRGNRGGGQYRGGIVGGASDEEVAAQERELFEPEERLVDLLADPDDNPLGLTFRVYSDDVNVGSAALADQVPLALWGIGPSAVHHGRDLDFPDTDRANIFLHGHTVSNAWGIDSGAPPPTFGKEIGLCGAPDDPAVPNAPEAFCARPGARPDEADRFVLDHWVAAYRVCRRGGGTDDVCQRAMPNVIYMALPVDHTLGFNPLSPTPASMVADNDYALGLIVDALSKSPFWRNTLVLATEDDTQTAGDHVDSHRTFLLAAGGLARTVGQAGRAAHQAGSFPSILKTIETLFRLPALTIYDRAAVPLHDAIVARLEDRNAVRYDAVRPPTPFLRNPEGTLLARISARLDWRLDRTDPWVLRDLLYAGIRGWPLSERALRLLRE
jgi:DNA-binding beta-propeller fold protein YncE